MKRNNLVKRETRENQISARFGLMFFIFILFVILSGCGGSDGGGGDTLSSELLLEGIFADSPVEGLEYETPTRTGITDGNGTFMYHEGDTIRFYVGDIMLGEALAGPMMTPVDLVDGAADETHPAVVNMARFLQTIDNDMNPENGITITSAMFDAMTGHMINFDTTASGFEDDTNVIAAIDAMNDVDMYGPLRMMVSAEDARNHLSNTIMNMMEEGYMMRHGTSQQLLEGVFVDSPVEGIEYETPIRTGMTDANGTFMYHEGDTIGFYVGDIMLGEAIAKPVMTPVDLVEGASDETHPAVVNMARFLQTMDHDMNPENGITITEAMSNALVDHVISFNIAPDQFAYDPDVLAAVDAINNIDMSAPLRMMVSPEDAINHLTDSINGMMSGDSSMM